MQWKLAIGIVLLGWLQGPPPGKTTLSVLRDRQRVLLIFAPAADDARLVAQLRVLEQNASGVRERDLVAIAAPEKGSAATEAYLEGAEAQAARARFKIAAGAFVVLLIGKDGGEKLRSSRPIAFEKLASVIDAMPMRREEMKQRDR